MVEEVMDIVGIPDSGSDGHGREVMGMVGEVMDMVEEVMDMVGR